MAKQGKVSKEAALLKLVQEAAFSPKLLVALLEYFHQVWGVFFLGGWEGKREETQFPPNTFLILKGGAKEAGGQGLPPSFVPGWMRNGILLFLKKKKSLSGLPLLSAPPPLPPPERII